MSTLALQIHYLFIHLCSHHSSPWTPPGPDSCLVSLTPVSPPPSTLGINHPETLISPCHFHTHSALPSHLQPGGTAFCVRGPCFSPPLSILPTKRTKSSCHGVLKVMFPPNLPQTSPLLGHLASTPHIHPRRLFCRQPQMLPSSVILVPLLQGPVNTLNPPSGRCGPLSLRTVSSAILYSVSDT